MCIYIYIYILILYIWEKWLWIGTCFQQTMLDSERTSTLGQFDPPEATNDPRASDHLHRCGLFFPASAGYGWKPRANVGSLSALICDFQNDMWRFPYMGILQNGWCIMGNPMKIRLNPIKMHDLEVPLFYETSIFTLQAFSELVQQACTHSFTHPSDSVIQYHPTS